MRIKFWNVIMLITLSLAALGPAPSARADHTPPPTMVVIPGTLQSALGCGGDWQTDCENTALVYNTSADVWEGTFDIPAGAYEYKVALNGTWAENYGLNGEQDG